MYTVFVLNNSFPGNISAINKSKKTTWCRKLQFGILWLDFINILDAFRYLIYKYIHLFLITEVDIKDVTYRVKRKYEDKRRRYGNYLFWVYLKNMQLTLYIKKIDDTGIPKLLDRLTLSPSCKIKAVFPWEPWVL